jgi:hypothetical protein
LYRPSASLSCIVNYIPFVIVKAFLNIMQITAYARKKKIYLRISVPLTKNIDTNRKIGNVCFGKSKAEILAALPWMLLLSCLRKGPVSSEDWWKSVRRSEWHFSQMWTFTKCLRQEYVLLLVNTDGSVYISIFELSFAGWYSNPVVFHPKSQPFVLIYYLCLRIVAIITYAQRKLLWSI